MPRRLRRVVKAFIVLGAAALLALSASPALLAQQSLRGVYRVDPDPATAQQGGQASATVESEDGGQRSCLNGTVPRTPPGGFQLSFASAVSPQFRARGSTTWSTTAFLDVASNVPPGTYEVSIWLQAYNNGSCTGAKLGTSYDFWDINVVVPPSPQPTPSTAVPPSPVVPPSPAGGPVIPSPTAFSETSGPTATQSDVASSAEGSAVSAGNFERNNPAGPGRTKRRHSFPSEIFDGFGN